jgi:hypothetical protein
MMWDVLRARSPGKLSEICAEIQRHVNGDMKCFLGYTYEALVPQDFVSCPAHLLRVADIMLNPKFVKLVAWYGLLQPRRGPHG